MKMKLFIVEGFAWARWHIEDEKYYWKLSDGSIGGPFDTPQEAEHVGNIMYETQMEKEQ